MIRGLAPWVDLGQWPTPLRTIRALGGEFYWKCEGDSHPSYGGNKLRTLEPWFGHARSIGATRLWAIGAYGSNHAIATILHGARIGLPTGAIIFPQPESVWERENYRAIIRSAETGRRGASSSEVRMARHDSEHASGSKDPLSDLGGHGGLAATVCELPSANFRDTRVVHLRSVVEVPFAQWRYARGTDLVMPPGGATPIGTFGAANAVIELAQQIDEHLAPPPHRIVLAAGSTCTAAGLLAGLALAARTGAWRHRVPIVHAVRVTPWPVTSRLRIAHLAHRTLARIAELGGPAVARDITLRELYAHLFVDGNELGSGYGKPTIEGRAAAAAFAHGPRLDGVYSAKAAAALLRLHRQGVGPMIFWSSKSTRVLTSASETSPAATA